MSEIFPVQTTPDPSAPQYPGVTEVGPPICAESELATGYSELSDPVVQRRFADQARAAAAGDDETMVLDEDFWPLWVRHATVHRNPEWVSIGC